MLFHLGNNEAHLGKLHVDLRLNPWTKLFAFRLHERFYFWLINWSVHSPVGCWSSSNSSVKLSRNEHHLGAGPRAWNDDSEQSSCMFNHLDIFSTHKENYENHDLLGYSKQAFWGIQLPWKLTLWKINKQKKKPIISWPWIKSTKSWNNHCHHQLTLSVFFRGTSFFNKKEDEHHLRSER